MKLYDLLGAYDFDEIMPVIVDMFPGTGKFRHQLKNAYRLLMGMRPVPSKKSIRFRVIHIPDSNESYMGAVDADFATTAGCQLPCQRSPYRPPSQGVR